MSTENPKPNFAQTASIKGQQSPDKSETRNNRVGKDEMNLVEHPFALLKRSKEKIFELEWEKQHPRTGKTIQSSWRVTGDPELGLPGPTEERLYLVLMELSREQDWPRKINFSRHDVLQQLGLTQTQANYEALHDSFLRLTSVTVDARRSFWKADKQDFASSLQFHILDEVEIIDEPAGRRAKQIPLALSSFSWSRVLHQSFIAGNVRSLHIEFALSLDLPLSARLFRYLDKHRTGDTEAPRHKYEIELHKLCGIHLGMTRAKYPSKLKERLLPALQELRRRQFLLDWAFEPMKSQPGCEKAVFYFANAPVEAPDVPVLPLSASSGGQSAKPGFGSDSGPILSILQSIELGEEESARLDAACDRVFETLGADAKQAIERNAFDALPPYLQNNVRAEGAKLDLIRNRRELVWSRHKAAVREQFDGR